MVVNIKVHQLILAAQGTTIPGGAVVWTGTCGGGVFFPDQTGEGIQSGDEVTVEIEKLGKVTAYPKFL